MDPLNVHANSEVCSVPEIIGSIQKIGQSLDMPKLPFGLFSQIFHGPLFGWTHVPAKFEVRSLTRSRDNSDWSFRWGCEPQSWGRGCRVGDGTVRKSIGEFL